MKSEEAGSVEVQTDAMAVAKVQRRGQGGLAVVNGTFDAGTQQRFFQDLPLALQLGLSAGML